MYYYVGWLRKQQILRQAQSFKGQLDQKSDEIALLIQLTFKTLSLPQNLFAIPKRWTGIRPT
jgi:hypothetical protein